MLILTLAVRRLALVAPVLLVTLLLVFLMLHLSPGDPARLLAGPGASDEVVQGIRRGLGLDRPVVVQLLLYLDRLARGDLGMSLQTRRPVIEELLDVFPNTLALAFWGMGLATLLGVPAGVLSAALGRRHLDRALVGAATVGVSLPTFLTGIALIYVFAFYWRILPVGGKAGFTSYILPIGTVAATQIALVLRLTRTAVLEALRQDYVRTARAKGQRERLVVGRHALRNALIPVVTGVGLQLAFLVGGLVVTESVFSWPGIGQLLVLAILQRDFPVVQGGVLLVALSVVGINFGTDLLVAYFNPRLRE